MLRVAALAVVVAVGTGGANRGLGNGKATFAALKCASARLPAAILAGANGAVSSDVDAEPLTVVTAAGGSTPLTLAVADDPRSRELGLMCVTALKPNAGMIFIFPRESDWGFWMKNTVTPLDMLWLSSDGTVHDVAANVPASTVNSPEDKIARRTGRGRYVVELRAGDAARNSIAVGTHLRLPAL